MTRAVWQGKPEHHPFPEDAAAMRLYARLARSFRGSMMLRVLSRALRYLILREADRGEGVLAAIFRCGTAATLCASRGQGIPRLGDPGGCLGSAA